MVKKICNVSGDVLRRARKKEGYTQEELADILGVTKKTVANWENEIHSLKGEKLEAVKDLLHLNGSEE